MCVRFDYNMNGYHTGTLRVFTQVNGGPPVTSFELQGDQMITWKHAALDLDLGASTEVSSWIKCPRSEYPGLEMIRIMVRVRDGL